MILILLHFSGPAFCCIVLLCYIVLLCNIHVLKLVDMRFFDDRQETCNQRVHSTFSVVCCTDQKLINRATVLLSVILKLFEEWTLAFALN